MLLATATGPAGSWDGEVPLWVSAMHVILGIIGQPRISGGVDHVIECTGKAISDLSMEGRRTACNPSIETGRWVAAG